MASRVFPLIEDAAADRVATAERRGIRKTVRAMVVGVPNVEIHPDQPAAGACQHPHRGQAGRHPLRPVVAITPYLEMLDSPGMLWPKLDDPVAARRLAYIGSVRDEAIDTYRLALHLADDLMDAHPGALMGRYKLDDPSLRGRALLEAVCRKRGFLLRGGAYDVDRAVATLLDEFRDGRIGRITLEAPPA